MSCRRSKRRVWKNSKVKKASLHKVPPGQQSDACHRGRRGEADNSLEIDQDRNQGEGSAENAEKARKGSLKLLRAMLGEGGLRAFLNCPQPAHGDATGEQILVRDPHGLFERLKEIEGRES